MKKFINKVKGFTLTELAIVIAVIAILIAVLVPTFVSLINSANESKDTQMIYNVNQALSIESATTTVKTPAQALEIAAEAGYNIDKLTPTSDSEIYYDQSNVRFVIKFSDGIYYPSSAAEDFDEDAPTTWKFVDEATYTSLNTATETASAPYSLAKASIKLADDEVTTVVHTCSYILTGEWSTTTISYTGMGGIDTTCATGINIVKYTIESDTSTTYTVNPVYSVSEEIGVVAITIKESNISTITKYCASVSTSNAVINSTEDSALNLNVDSVDGNTKDILWDNTTITVTVTSEGEDITAKASSDVSINDLIDAINSYETALESAKSDGTVDVSTITIQLGNERYPWLITTETELAEKLVSSLDTVYLQLQNNITLSADKTIDITSNVVINGDSNSLSLDNYSLSLGDYSLTINAGDYDISIINTNVSTSKSQSEIAYADAFVINSQSTVQIENCAFNGTKPGDYLLKIKAIENAVNISIKDSKFTNATIILWGASSGSISVSGSDFIAEGDAAKAVTGITAYSCKNSTTINLTECNFSGQIRYAISNDNSANSDDLLLNLNTVTFDVTIKLTIEEQLLAFAGTVYTPSCGLCSNAITINSNVNSYFYYTYSDETMEISADYAVENN